MSSERHVAVAVEPGTVTVSFDGDERYLGAEAKARIDFPLVFGDGSGFFAVGPNGAAIGSTVKFWTSSSGALNLITAPPLFKGFVTSTLTPVCGSTCAVVPGTTR